MLSYSNRWPLSAKQFAVFICINVIFWIISLSTRNSSSQDANNQSESSELSCEGLSNGEFSDEVPSLLPLDDANLETNVLLKPVHVGPNKKQERSKSHLPCPLELEAERKFRLYMVNNVVKFNLDRNKFLMNISPGELNTPEEQLLAFKETLFLAIYLNRTVVLPSFFKDNYDSSTKNNVHGKKTIDAQDFIAINKLMKYFPVITIDELYEHCTSFGSAYLLPNLGPLPLKDPILEEMHRIEKTTGVHLLDPEMNRFRGNFIKTRTEMLNSPLDKKGRITLNSNFIQNQLFEDIEAAKCSLVINPKNDIQYGNYLNQWNTMMGSVEMMTDPDTDIPAVSAMVMKALGRPKWIKNVADKFKASYGLDRGYMAMILDDKDYESLINEMNRVAQSFSFGHAYVVVDSFYDQNDIDNIINQIQSKTSVKLIQRKTLKEFIQIKYHECPNERLSDELDETLELVEMQVAYQANSLVASLKEGGSNWGWVQNLRDERLAWRATEFDSYLS